MRFFFLFQYFYLCIPFRIQYKEIRFPYKISLSKGLMMLRYISTLEFSAGWSPLCKRHLKFLNFLNLYTQISPSHFLNGLSETEQDHLSLSSTRIFPSDKKKKKKRVILLGKKLWQKRPLICWWGLIWRRFLSDIPTTTQIYYDNKTSSHPLDRTWESVW